MASVVPGYVFTSASDPITFSKLNLLGQPVVSIGSNEIITAMIADNSVTVAKLAQATGGGFLGRTTATLGNISFIQLNDGGITWPTYGMAISKASNTTEFDLGESDLLRFRMQYNSAFPGSLALKITVSDTGTTNQDYGNGNTTWVGGAFTYSIGDGTGSSTPILALSMSGIATIGLLASSASVGVGYATGVSAGGTVTQSTDKSTAVSLAKTTGQITMNAATLNAATTVSFTLTNTSIAATDILVLNHVSGGTAGAYTLNAQCASGSALINVRNVTAGNLSEAIVIGFVLIKGSIN